MIEKCSNGELEAWRADRRTAALMRDLEAMHRSLMLALRRSGTDGELDRIRFVTGQIEGLEQVQKLIMSSGDEDE